MEKESYMFKEVQWNKIKWVWAVVIGIGTLMWYAFYVQIIGGKEFGSNPAPDSVLMVFTFIFGIIFPIFILTFHQITEVRDSGVYIRMSPFPGRFIPLSQIKSYKRRTYNAIAEYGGWGIRFGFNGRAYNLSGNQGIQLSLESNSNVLIGTGRPEDFNVALNKAMGMR